MENEPSFIAQFEGGQEIEATRDNTTLFTHIGRLALYDHVFIVLDEEENRGSYIFQINPAFEGIADFMIANEYPMHLNLREVADCDLEAYDGMIKGMVGDIDTLPPEWTNETDT